MDGRSILVSIITVTYNEGEKIIPTVESVLSFFKGREVNYQYIVVDGNSSDNTLALLSRYSELSIISEPDNGIYDAMNKGLKVATGKWVYFINSGDLLYTLPIDVMRDSVHDLLACSVRTESGLLIPSWGKSLMWRNSVPHQGAIYRKDGFINYDLRYRVFSDYHHNIHLFKSGARVLLIPQTVAFHSECGISNNRNHIRELYRLLWNEYGPFGVLLTWVRFKFIGLNRRYNGK